jgi:hypothetical protein
VHIREDRGWEKKKDNGWRDKYRRTRLKREKRTFGSVETHMMRSSHQSMKILKGDNPRLRASF